MKKALLILLVGFGILFIAENSYFLFIKGRKSIGSPISSAKQLFLAVSQFHADHLSDPKSYPESYPKTLNDLVKSDYLTASNITELFPQGIWIYNCPKDDSRSDEIFLTGYFSAGILTCTVGGEISTMKPKP